MNSFISILFYNVILLVLFLYCYRKNGYILNSTNYIFLFLFVCGIISTLYFLSVEGLIRDYSNIEIAPFIYLIMCYSITIMPIYFYDCKKNLVLNVTNEQYDFLKKFSILLIIISVEPLLENIYHLNDIIGNSQYAARMYDNRIEYLSFWGRKLHAVSTYFEILYPILILYFLIKPGNQKIVIGLVFVTLNFWLHELGLGGRSKMVQSILYAIAVYFLMRRFLNKVVDRKIQFYGIVFLSIGIVFVLLISISRFDAMSSTTDITSIWMWLGLYAGEGVLNFNSLMWNVTETTSGNDTFIFLRHELGYTESFTVEDLYAGRSKLGIPENIFYTYVGSIYRDFNFYGTIVFLLLFSLLTVLITKCRNSITFVQIVFLSLCIKILSVPTFYTYNTYKSQFDLVFIYVFCLIMCFIRLKKV